MAGTLVANTINTDTGLFSTNNAYSGIAKAWAYYNGSSATLNGSFNVGSVTKNSTGNYTFNFTTAMSNATYATTTGVSYDLTTGTGNVFVKLISQSTSAVNVLVLSTGGSAIDAVYVAVAVND